MRELWFIKTAGFVTLLISLLLLNVNASQTNAEDFTVNVTPSYVETNTSAIFHSICKCSPMTYFYNFMDGSPTQQISSQTFSHTFTKAGVYQVQAEVLTSMGEQLNTSVCVEVFDSLTYLHANKTVFQAYVNETVELSVLCDPSRLLLSFWEFGDNETLLSNQTTAAHVYNEPGIYLVNITVTNPVSKLQNFTFVNVILRPIQPSTSSSDSHVIAISVATPFATLLLVVIAVVGWKFYQKRRKAYIEIANFDFEIPSVRKSKSSWFSSDTLSRSSNESQIFFSKSGRTSRVFATSRSSLDENYGSL